MFAGQPLTIEYLTRADGTGAFTDWLIGLRDKQAQARIAKRVTRLEEGNPGDYKFIGEGVYGIRIDYGPGYRVYLAFTQTHIILLLGGGTKKTQATDIENAQSDWREYQKGSTL